MAKSAISSGSLKYSRHFTKDLQDGQTVYDRFRWDKRDVVIKDDSGNVIYNGIGLESPENWSNMALRIVGSKYMHIGDEPEKPVETSVKQLTHRVVNSLTQEAENQGTLSKKGALRFYDDLAYLVTDQRASFNSPVWFNVGLNEQYGVREDKPKDKPSAHWAINQSGNVTNMIDVYERPQGSACFIQNIDDNMESILDHSRKEGMLFKQGSGSGTNYSRLRGINEPLKGGGVASGEISFLRIYDIIAGRIQAAGKTRRAAKMVITDDKHPDFLRFIFWKPEEEKKALWLSSNPEWGPSYPGDLESIAYKTVDGQNGNNSVRLTDDFMQAAMDGEDWDLMYLTGERFEQEEEIPLNKYKEDKFLPDKRYVKRNTNKRKTINAGEAFDLIARAAYAVGDPGIQFDTTINEWNTCPNSGKIRASNPCSEFMFLDDSACNLASLNLPKFQTREGEFDIEGFESAVKTIIIGQETLVDYGSYPSKEIAENSHRFRPLGLGYTNIGGLLMERGIAYNSDEGRALATAITSLMTAKAYETSAELATHKGAFAEYERNKEPMLRVLGKHRDHLRSVKRNVKSNNLQATDLERILNEADKVWDRALKKGREYGFRNSQVTLLAPTGTIGFMMDVDCTGVEPMVGLKTYKGLAGGGTLNRSVAPSVVKGLKALGYTQPQREKILDYVEENGTVVDAPELARNHYKVFQTALGDNAISVDGHLEMVAAVQPALSGGISKTVNLPRGSTIQDIKDVYTRAWKLGLKSVTPYVDGAKGAQPVTLVQKNGKGEEPKWGDRIRPPDSMEGYRKHVHIGGSGIHFVIGEYGNRKPGDSPADFFVEFGSSGSAYSAIYESWAKEASWNRQRGEPLAEFVTHNLGATGTIRGMTDHPHIKTCSSIEDFLAKMVMLEYLGDTSKCDVLPTPKEMEDLRCNVLAKRRRRQHYDSRIKRIDSIMRDGEVTEIFPLYEDETPEGEIKIGSTFCVECGHVTELSGANCRKCTNCGNSSGCG